MLPWNVEDLTFDETRFSGKVRLFPLPDLVMFPHVMQPLHIFEPRYREMLSDALDHDGLIAMSVLKQGSEVGSLSQPSIESTACLGKIVTHQRLDNGGYNLLLLGMRRVRLVQELATERPFRQAEVDLLEDLYCGEEAEERESLQTALTHQFQQRLPDGNFPPEAIREALASEIPLGVLTDLVSFAMPFESELKYSLLKQQNVDRRAWMLLEALEQLSEGTVGQPSSLQRTFPPPFSIN